MSSVVLDQVSAGSVTLSEDLARYGFSTGDWVTGNWVADDWVADDWVAEEWAWRADAITLVGHQATIGVMATVRRLDRIASLLRAAAGGGGQIGQIGQIEQIEQIAEVYVRFSLITSR